MSDEKVPLPHDIATKNSNAIVVPAFRYKPADAARALSISLRKLEELISDGSLVVHQDSAGGTRYVSAESIRAYIERREEVPVIGRFSRVKS